MKDSQNPLDKFKTYQIKYILVAFAYTEDACMTDFGPSIGPPETQFSGQACGKQAMVIVNQFENEKYVITKYTSDFNFFSSISPTSTQMLGELLISDRIGGEFPSFLRRASQKLEVSISHMAFSLKIYFIGQTPDGKTETIVTKPLIFNTPIITHAYSPNAPHSYVMNFVATYNTFGLLPTFSKLYQMTITNVDGNPSTEIPKPDIPLSTILPRAVEDGLKFNARKARIDKSKTMETLDDVFKGLREDLQQMKFEHKRQLQEWQSFIRDDYVKKIDQPKQIKPAGIPVDYIIGISPEYKSYKIDNRNMPFEQPEQSQEKYGVRSIPIPNGEHLLNCIERIMKYSRKIGEDAGDTFPKKVFKTVITVIRRCNGKYDVFIGIKRIIKPTNTPNGMDTGPGQAIEPLYFEYQNTGTEDTNIESISAKMTSQFNLRMMENQVDDPDAEVVFGNREQATAERSQDLNFFQSMFSGLRTTINSENNGLESAKDAGEIDNNIINIPAQKNHFTTVIHGNPNILSDLSRNPFMVKNDEADNPTFYVKPEVEPMYAKVLMYLDPPAKSLDIMDDESDKIYYFTKFYHLYRVTTVIDGDKFSQNLSMLRTDDTA